ncbi:Tautomerase family protein [Rubrivivax sp. A210]|uniref:tautomerase family protein n=1 Tax=Rubrivivax sp. A210 TaxID=2772301 RepID=UPI00191AB4D4|nr:tautomerase family protein [Rubrivivax sp. A210]CAD5373444.1 Tautomerase family protein [Rubrivivax sp. A210]
MPSCVIEVCRPYTPAEEEALMESVHEALVEAFRIAPANRNVTLLVHAPHRFMGRPDCPDPTRLTNVSIHVLPGRSLAAKRRLYRAICERLQALGVPPACVLIRLHEMSAENIAVRGGQAVCDIELGYPLDV